MILEYVGRIIFLLVCIFFISGLYLAVKQISAQEAKPSTVLGFFNLLCFAIIIIVFLLFDINKLHIIWLLLLVFLLSRNKYAFQIGVILFNMTCFLLRKPNVVNDKDNILFKNSESNNKDGENILKQAIEKFKLGDYKNAVSLYNKAINQNPNHPGIYYGRGMAKFKSLDFQNAKKDFDKAIEMNPNYSEAYRDRGRTISKLGDIKGSINDYTKAIELEPKDFESYFSRGLSYVLLKEHEIALKDFTEAVKLNPQFADAHFHKGLMHWISGNNQEAFNNWNKASGLGNTDAKEMLKKI